MAIAALAFRRRNDEHEVKISLRLETMDAPQFKHYVHHTACGIL
jgi:hypothetical protein